MRKKVMIVDDSRTVRQQVSLLLSRAGYDIEEACDGLDASEKIERSLELSLVICDVNMPRMSGLEMLKRVKGQGKHLALPVLMLTTEGQPGLMTQAKSAGAKGWIVKPFDPDVLVETVRKLAGEP